MPKKQSVKTAGFDDYDWAQDFVSAARTVADTPHLAKFPPRTRNDIVYAIGMLRILAARAAGALTKCSWTEAMLRGDGRDLRHPWDCLRSAEKNKGSRNRFDRMREHQLTLDHCRVAERAIHEGDWIAALCAAISAGNHSQGDQAIIGRKRGKGLFKPGYTKPSDSPKSLQRNLILREARTLKQRYHMANSSSVARWIAKQHNSDSTFPKWEAIRKILRADRSWENLA